MQGLSASKITKVTFLALLDSLGHLQRIIRKIIRQLAVRI
jgi:hypothetical protein